MEPPRHVQNCAQCGAGLTLDDMRGSNCRYCGTVLKHHAQAMQQVAVINQMMQGGGPFGMGGMPGGVTPQVDYRAGHGPQIVYHGTPPGMPPGQYGQPYDINQVVNHSMQTARRTVVMTFAIVAGVMVLSIVLVVVLALV